MACFIVPAAEAIVVTVAEKALEKKNSSAQVKLPAGEEKTEQVSKTGFVSKLKWLRNLLWGGCILLAFEHLWHGEIVPWFPFLTAAGDPVAKSEMLHEMATVGVTMAIVVTVAWIIMVAVSTAVEKRNAASKRTEEGEK